MPSVADEFEPSSPINKYKRAVDYKKPNITHSKSKPYSRPMTYKAKLEYTKAKKNWESKYNTKVSYHHTLDFINHRYFYKIIPLGIYLQDFANFTSNFLKHINYVAM